MLRCFDATSRRLWLMVDGLRGRMDDDAYNVQAFILVALVRLVFVSGDAVANMFGVLDGVTGGVTVATLEHLRRFCTGFCADARRPFRPFPYTPLGRAPDAIRAGQLAVIDSLCLVLQGVKEIHWSLPGFQRVGCRASSPDAQFGMMQMAMDLFYLARGVCKKAIREQCGAFLVRGPGCYLVNVAQIKNLAKFTNQRAKIKTNMSDLGVSLRSYWPFAVEHGDCGTRKHLGFNASSGPFIAPPPVAMSTEEIDRLIAEREYGSEHTSYRAVLAILQRDSFPSEQLSPRWKGVALDCSSTGLQLAAQVYSPKA